jgi:hypothetical protein
MADKSMPHHYWVEAVAIAIYIMNKTPTTTVHGMTPERSIVAENQICHT